MKISRSVWKYVLLAIALIVIISLCLVLVFRNSIAESFLESYVNKHSDNKMILSIENVHIGLSGGILIQNPSLHFRDTYVDGNKSVEINQLSIDSILLHGFSIKDLIRDNRSIADSIELIRPEIFIEEHEGLQKDINDTLEQKFDPVSVFKRIVNNSFGKIKEEIKIGKISISKGVLNVNTLVKHDTSYSINYNIIVDGFSTLAEDNIAPKNRFIYSKDIQFEIRNINKLLVSGYDLDLGSMVFSIKKNFLRINQASIYPNRLSDSINQIALKADLIDLEGLTMDEISGRENVTLNAVRISNGYFVTNTNHIHKTPKGLYKEIFKEFSELFSQFRLDTLNIQKFDLEFLEFLSDTIAYVDDLNLSVYGLTIDSSMFDDLFRKLEFDEFDVSAANGVYRHPATGIHIQVDSSKYSSISERIEFFGPAVIHKASSDIKNRTMLDAGRIQIDGLSKEPIPYPGKIHLDIIVEDLDGRINIAPAKASSSSPMDLESFLELIDIESFQMQNTSLNFVKQDLKVQFDKLDLNIDNSMRTQDVGLADIELDRIRLQSGELGLNIGQMDVSSVSLDRLMGENSLEGGNIILEDLSLNGDINIPDSEPSAAGPSLRMPFEFVSFDSLTLKNGQIDNTITHASDEIHLRTGLQVNLSDIQLDEADLKIATLDKFNGEININGTKISGLGHLLRLDELSLNLTDDGLLLRNLDISHMEEEQTRLPIILDELRLSLFHFQGFQFDLEDYDQKADNNERAIDLSFMQTFDYDKFQLQELFMKMAVLNSGGTSFIQVADLNFLHKKIKLKEHNFLQDIQISFGPVSFKDTTKYTSIQVESGRYDPLTNTLKINNISGGNLGDSSYMITDRGGWNYKSSELNIEGLFALNSFPTRLDINKVSLKDSYIDILSDKRTAKDANLKFDIESFQRIGSVMSRLKIDTTYFMDVMLQYRTFDDTTTKVFMADSIGMVINDITIDSNVFDENAAGVVEKMSVDFKGRTHISSDSLYEIRFGKIRYNFFDDIITIDSFEMNPRFEEEAFFKRLPYQTDRMTLFSDRITLRDFRLEELIHNDHIHFGGIGIDSIYLDMRRDKRYPLDTSKIKLMPQKMLREIGQNITIDSIKVINSFLSYGEYVEKSSVPGTIYFSDFNLNLYNITSDQSRLPSTTALTVEMNCKVMGQARADVSIFYPYLNQTSDFWMYASSEPLELTSLNPLTEYLLGITILRGSGYLQESFISGNDNYSKGSLMFKYKKLKLGLYNRHKAQENKGMFAGVTRFLINDLLIHSNNPKFTRKPRTGQVYFERDINKSIINYVWKSLLSGMISTIGFNTREQKEERREMKKISHDKEIVK